jgi:hypothetical protein
VNWLKSRMESAYWSPSNDSVVSNEDSTSRTFHRTTSAQVSVAMLPTLGKTFRPVRAAEKKIQFPTKFYFLKGLWADENFVICVYVEVRPLFGPVCTKSAKIRPQLCPAALLFIRSFLKLWGRTIGQLAGLICSRRFHLRYRYLMQ